MSDYFITMPITGIICKEIEANTEEEALEKFWQSEITIDDIEDWEIHEHIITGNVFHGLQNDYEIEEA